jgi:hypothetical protein
MNKIEILHVNCNGIKYPKFASSVKAHYKVTEDIACKFAEWATDQGEWNPAVDKNNNDAFIWTNTYYEGISLTTSELFSEFIKTL